jgi:hypothetical protein
MVKKLLSEKPLTGMKLPELLQHVESIGDDKLVEMLEKADFSKGYCDDRELMQHTFKLLAAHERENADTRK